VIEPTGSGSLLIVLHATDAMAAPVFAELVRRLRKHFFTETALD
jgi:hypothetical protein